MKRTKGRILRSVDIRISVAGLLLLMFALSSSSFALDCKKNANCQKKKTPGSPVQRNAQDPTPPKPVPKPVVQTPSPKVEAQGPKDLVAIVDVTGSTDSERDLNQKCFIRNVNDLKVGDGFAAITATDVSFVNPEYLVNYQVLPSKAGEWELQLRRAKARICTEFVNKIKNMPLERPATSLIDAIFLSTHMLSEGHNPRKVLLIISDMREHRKELNEDTILQRGDDILSGMRAVGQIPDLSNTQIYCVGVSTYGFSPHAWGKLRDWWFKFFASGGGSVKAYDVGRHRQID